MKLNRPDRGTGPQQTPAYDVFVLFLFSGEKQLTSINVRLIV